MRASRKNLTTALLGLCLFTFMFIILMYNYGFVKPRSSFRQFRSVGTPVNIVVTVSSNNNQHDTDSTGQLSNEDIKQDISHARMYCNPPQQIKRGDEGKVINGYKLLSVYTILRHGNRLPMGDYMKLGPLNVAGHKVSCIMDTTKSTIPKDLKGFIDRARGKKPSGGWSFDICPNKQYCLFADLTQIGVEQQIMNGKALREAYAGLLPLDRINLSVKATVIKRTFQSAMALLYGFTPSIDYSRLTVQQVWSGAFFCKAKVCDCPLADRYIQKGLATLGAAKDSDENFLAFSKSVKETAGRKYTIEPYYPWKGALDIMTLNICRDTPLPCNNDACLTEEQADMNWRSLNNFYRKMSLDSDMKAGHQLYTYDLLHDIVSKMYVQSKMAPLDEALHEFALYSGHDDTLIPVLIALGYTLDTWPPFASKLVMELYKADQPNKSTPVHIVKFIYNGRDITKGIGFCKDVELCSLDRFSVYLNNIALSHGKANVNEACHR